jgi:hypothetical protein
MAAMLVVDRRFDGDEWWETEENGRPLNSANVAHCRVVTSGYLLFNREIRSTEGEKVCVFTRTHSTHLQNKMDKLIYWCPCAFNNSTPKLFYMEQKLFKHKTKVLKK